MVEGLNPDIFPSGGDTGIISPEIRGKVYSVGELGYDSEHVCVYDGEELEDDIRRAIYDLEANPVEWRDDVLEDVLEREENGRVNGEDIATVLREYRELF